jgi:hypothetical protein
MNQTTKKNFHPVFLIKFPAQSSTVISPLNNLAQKLYAKTTATKIKNNGTQSTIITKTTTITTSANFSRAITTRKDRNSHKKKLFPSLHRHFVYIMPFAIICQTEHIARKAAKKNNLYLFYSCISV